MKKYFLLFLVLLLVFTGCGKKDEKDVEKDKVTTGQTEAESKIVCTLSSVNSDYSLNATYTIYYEGKYVDYVHSVENLKSNNESALNTIYSSTLSSYKKMKDNYGGYDFNIEKTENTVVSDIEIYYSRMNLQRYINDNPSMKKYVENDKMMVEGVKSLYTQIGAKCN